MNLKTLKADLETEARAMLDAATVERRDLTVSESARFDQISNDIDSINARMARNDEQQRTNRDVAESIRNLGINPSGGSSLDDYADQIRDLGLRRTGEAVTVRGKQDLGGRQIGAEARALAKGTATAGGYTVPTGLYDQIVTSLVETSAVLNAGATILTTDSGEDLTVPREATMLSAAITAEAAPIPQSDPTFNTVTLRSFKYGVLVKCSRELLEDSGVDFTGYLARQTGVALGLAFGNHLVNGTGTNQPSGILVGSTLGVTGPTGAVGGFGSQATAGQGTDLLNSLQASVLEPYAQSPAAAYIGRNATRNLIRNLKSSTGDLVGNQWLSQAPAPWFADPFMPSVAVNAKSVVFGDFSRYWARIVNGIRFERSDDFAFDTDQVTFRAIMRADGAVIDTSAFKYFVGAAS